MPSRTEPTIAPGRLPETAEHRRDEGLVRDLTDGGLDDEAHAVEHTGEAGEHAAHEEDDEDHEIAVDAHEGRGLLTVRAGADGKADLGFLYDEHQNQQRDGRDHDPISRLSTPREIPPMLMRLSKIGG